MRTRLFLSVFIIFLWTQITAARSPVLPGQSLPRSEEAYSGSPLCLPDVYLQNPSGCLPLGPSVFLTQRAIEGVPYPERPIPAVHPDLALSYMDYSYIKVSRDSFPLYASLDDAIAHRPGRNIDGGMKYLVNIERVEAEGGVYYELPSGEWINGGEAGAACCITNGRFTGLIVRGTLRNALGWILTTTPVYTAPGYASAQTGRELNREDMVQVYRLEQADNVTWVMIGLNEWIEDRVVGRITPNPVAPEGVDNGRWIEVNLEEQAMLVYDQNRLVYATMISTGVDPFFTRPGLFKIEIKKDIETMQGSFEADRSDFYYLQNVPWTMYFDQARALHGAYWHTLFGYPQSHGCVNLSPGDAHWLYDWARQGDWVYVWDPSGKTPTDPAYYGAGGA